MGNFYTSFTARGADHDGVVKAMNGRTAAVSPTMNGYTVVWDAECEKQDQRIINRLGEHLSSKLVSPVIAILIHDDDIFWYGLYSPHGKLDEYNSAPGYFEGHFDAPPAGGNAQLLTSVIAPDVSHELIERVLRSTDYVLATERHAALLEALGLPPFAASVGYQYIANGELPQGLRKVDLTFTQ